MCKNPGWYVIDFVESHGWYYGGGIYEYDEKRDGNVDSNEE